MDKTERDEFVSLTIEAYERLKEKEKAEREKNTIDRAKILIENYRAMKDMTRAYQPHCCTGSTDCLIEESERTLLAVKAVENALDSYKSWCENTHKDDEMRRYKTIDMIYIGNKSFSTQEVAEIEYVDVATVYRDIRVAIQHLAPRIFGLAAFW